MASPSADVHVICISCGSSHSVALLSNGTVLTWGRGEDGQLGHGDSNERDVPEAVASLHDKAISSVHCGAEYTVALSSSQSHVYSWGWGDFGRLGHGTCYDAFVPEVVADLVPRHVTTVACGDTHTLAITNDGQLWSFGRNQNGQLGLGTRDDSFSPQRVASLEGKRVVSIGCGAEHSLVATDEGEVFSWGWGRYGNLGDGECEDRLLPTKVKGLQGVHVQAVACGWRHSIVVDGNGRVFSFGWSKYGQLGHGDNQDQLVPKQLLQLRDTKVVVIAGGWRHSMAADSEGRVYAWGWNKFGQLGIGSYTDSNTPELVTTLADMGERVSLLACGWKHTMAVAASGKMYAWGRGTNGQLGTGETGDQNTPQLVEVLSKGSICMDALQGLSNAGQGWVSTADRYAVVPDQVAPNGGVSVPDLGNHEPASKRMKV